MCIPNLKPDSIIDKWFDLELPDNLKAKHKDALDERIGNVHLRLYFSVQPETPDPIPDNTEHTFNYKAISKQMKTGDLILYSGHGCFDAVSKIYSGSQYSRVGIVLKIPNRHTKKLNLYVAESGRNIGGFIDAFKEKSESGVNIFNLKERLHYFNGSTIWWSPLKDGLDQNAGEQNMIEWIESISSHKIPLEHLPPLPQEMTSFFDGLEININKIAGAVEEINSAAIFIHALRLSGKRFPIDAGFLPPVRILVNDYFEQPVVIRCIKGFEDVDGIVDTESEDTQAEKRLKVSRNKSFIVSQSDAFDTAENRKRAKSTLPSSGKKLSKHRSFKHKTMSNHSMTVSPREKSNDSVSPRDIGIRRHESMKPVKSISPRKDKEQAVTNGDLSKGLVKTPRQDKLEDLSTETNKDVQSTKSEPSPNSQPPPLKEKPSNLTKSTFPKGKKPSFRGPTKGPFNPGDKPPLPPKAQHVLQRSRPRPPSEALDLSSLKEGLKAESKIDSESPVNDPPEEIEKSAQESTGDITNDVPEVSTEAPKPKTSKKSMPRKASEAESTESTMKQNVTETVAPTKKKKSKHESKSEESVEKAEKHKHKKKKSIKQSTRKEDSSCKLKQAVVKWDFEAENEGELTCKEGDILEVVDDNSDPEWIVVKLKGIHGCVPRSFVDIL